VANYNRVILMGRLTRDPELRYTGGGTAVCNFAIAVNRRVKKGDDWAEEASFFDIVAFGKRGEAIAEYLSKGRPIFVEGELQQRRWEGQDGQKRSRIEVLANRFEFIDSRGEGSGAPGAGGPDGDDAPPPLEDDDIPF